MAAPKAAEPLDVLEQMINEVIVQSGKALRENSRNGKKASAINSAQRIEQANAKFNTALGDLEVDIVRAKSVLLRDLAQIQAKKQPAPAPQSMPQAPPAPMTIDLESPKLQHASVTSPVLSRPPVRTEPKKAAPFPNMGIEPPKCTSPKLGLKGKPSPTPQPMRRAGSQGGKQPGKVGTPSMNSGSPATTKSVSPAMTKAASPALAKTASASPVMTKAAASAAMGAKTGSPALGGGSPMVKTASAGVKAPSPSVNVNAKPAPKVTPSPAMPKAHAPAPTPAPVPITAPNPAPTPVMTIPATASAPANTDNSLSNFFDLTSPTTTTTAPGGGGAGHNFTEMQFSLAPAAGDSRPQVPSADEDFDIEAYVGDVSQSLLTDDNFGIGGAGGNAGPGQVGAPSMDITMGITGPVATGDPPKADGKAAEAQMDDLFNLTGTSIDMDLELSGEGADETTNFDELFFDAADTSMDEFNDAYFGIQ